MKSFSFVIALVVLTSGCATRPPQRPTFKLSDFRSSTLKELPYDSPPQTIYRIDDHRFVTLERYRDCNHGESYYNDTRMGIRKYLGRGRFDNFQGRILNADHSFRPFDDSKRYTFAVLNVRLFVAKNDYADESEAYVREYPMVYGIDLSKPYPPGIRGSSFAESKRPNYLRGASTTSGQDRITCDSSLKPTNPDAPPTP